jgi:predicted CXXCH cytochrome family protein
VRRSFAISCLLIGACGSPPSPKNASRPVAGEVSSNILRADYAGSAACEKCHADLYAGWHKSPMHNMTRVVDGAQIEAPFDRTFHFKEDAVDLSTTDGARFMQLRSSRFGDHLFRVTRVIGGHHREDFAGVEVAERSASAPLVGDRSEHILPVSWLLGPRAFRYKGYSVMVVERPGLKVAGEWARTCIFCHNTVPYFDDLFGALAGPGTAAYQGEVVDALLPPERAWNFQVSDENGLKKALADELAILGTRPDLDAKSSVDALREAVRATRNRFRGDHLLEVGIGCESCHGGSREHVQTPSVKPSFAVKSRFLYTVPSGKSTTAQLVNRTCARCHQVLFSRYPYTWEGGTRRGHEGGANINSGEGRDLLLGACASQLSCVACHDPHAPDNREKMAALEGEAGDAICLRCHEKYRGAQAVAAHTHHSPTGKGARCLACHMAKKNLSLEVRLGRYHRIGSPTDEARVTGDRPLECALCHADRSVEQLTGDMEKFWGKRYDRAVLRRLYGENLASVNPLLATLSVGKPHEVAAAAMTLGDARDRRAVAPLLRQLGNPIPLVRWYVLAGLEKIAGSPSGIDLHQEVAAIDREARAWLAKSGIAVDGAASATIAAPQQSGASDGED